MIIHGIIPAAITLIFTITFATNYSLDENVEKMTKVAFSRRRHQQGSRRGALTLRARATLSSHSI
jgi:hypothetical protein